jgi:uncharacterized repeat protein (TIGR02543 family)
MEKLSLNPFLRGSFGLLVLIFALAGAPALFGQEYVVTFDTDGGSEQNSIEVGKGEKIGSIQEPTRGNDKFLGWFREKGLTRPWSLDRDPVNTNITLYAKWQVIHKVEFLSDDISVKIEDCEDGKPVAEYKASKDGYFDFAGWYEDKDCTGAKWDFKEPIDSDKTFYAKWTPRPEEEILQAISKNFQQTKKYFNEADAKADGYFSQLLICCSVIAFLTLLFGIFLLLFAARNNVLKEELAKIASKDDLRTVREEIDFIKSLLITLKNNDRRLPEPIVAPRQDTSAYTREIDKLEKNNARLEVENRGLKRQVVELQEERRISDGITRGALEPKDVFNRWVEDPVKPLPRAFCYTSLPKQPQFREVQNFSETGAENAPWITNREGAQKYLFPNPRVIDQMTDITTFYKGGTGFTKGKGQNRFKITKACEMKSNGFIEFPGELEQL